MLLLEGVTIVKKGVPRHAIAKSPNLNVQIIAIKCVFWSEKHKSVAKRTVNVWRFFSFTLGITRSEQL